MPTEKSIRELALELVDANDELCWINKHSHPQTWSALKNKYDKALDALRAALSDAPDDRVLVPREPRPGLLCGDVAVSTDPRYAGWVFVRHADGENWTTCAKMSPETWAMLAASEPKRHD